MSKLVSIRTYEVFKSLWDNNNINELSLNFIVDTLQLYTHGMFINSATFGTENSNTIPLTIAGVSKTLALSGHTHSNYYDKTANLDIGNYSIVSGNNELLKATGGSLYLGNVSNPTYISGNHLYSIKGLNTYTILDTGNFEVTNKDSNGYTYYNKAIIKYGTSFEIDYVKRDNSLTSLDNLHNYTSAGTTKVNNVTYGFITLRTDTEFSNPSWAQLRIDIPGLTVQFRTSANPDNWKDITVPTINLNALNVAGIVKAPSSSTTNKVWKTDENGNPDWRDDSNSLYSLTLNGTTKGNTGGTDLGTFYAVATSNASEANQVWMRNSDNTAYAWRILGSRAFDSTAYLPLSGGTMTGGINFSISGSSRNAIVLRKSVYEQLFGWSWDNFDGAGLGFYNSDASGTDKGCFYLYTSNGSNHVYLNGRSDGTLTWNGKSLYHSGNLTKVSQLTNDSGYIASSGGQMTGHLTWKDADACPERTSVLYVLTLDAFASGGTTGWASIATLKTSLGLGSNAYTSTVYLPTGGGTITGELINQSGGIWVQGGSNAGGNVGRMGLVGGMPTNLAYNTSKRGVRIYSNAIAFADPYNGNSNNDSGWIRHIEETANSGVLEIAVGDDGNEEIRFRRYNTSSNIVSDVLVPNITGTLALTSQIPTNNNQLTNGAGYITSYTDTKNTAGTTNKTATKMFLVGATSQAANPQTYSNSNVYIGTDNCLYSNGTKVLTSHQSLSNYVKLNPGTTEQTIKSSIGTISKGVINLWRSSGNHVTFLGFSNGTTETYLGGIGFKSQEDTNLYHRATGGSSYKIWDENNDGASSGLDADLLDGYHASSFPLIRNINDSAGDAFADVLKGYSGTFFFYGNNLKGGQNDWVGLQIGYSADKGQIIFENGTLSVRHNDSGGTNTTGWSDWEKLARITDNVASATKLATARTINGTSFDGSANITTTNWGTARNISITDSDSTNTGTAVSVNGSAAVTLKLPSTIKATLSGNAASATKLKTARTIWGQSFDGSADISGSLSGVSEIDFSNANGTTMDQYGNIKLKAASTSASYWIVRNVDNVIGIVMTAAGNVGIGTNSPTHKLDVEGTLGVKSYVYVDRAPYGALPQGEQINILSARSMNAGTGTYSSNAVIATFGSGETGTTVNNFPVRIGSVSGATWISAGESGKTFSNVNTDICNTENLYLTADGNMLFYAGLANNSTNYASKLVVHIDGTNRRVAINKSSASYPLDVSGNCGATNFYTTSDRSKKDNITSLSEHIRKFTLKETGKEHYGVIAQEVEEMFREGEEGNMTVNYNSVLSYYVGQLENRVKELENEILKLKSK